MYRTLPILMSLSLPLLAVAQDEPADTETEGSDTEPETTTGDTTPTETPPEPIPAGPMSSKAKGPEGGRQFKMELGFRGRYMTVPEEIIDIWFFNAEDEGWADGNNERPHLGGWSVGGEFVINGDGPNAIFYFDWVTSTMQPGYWDDREEPADHTDGDYLEPADDLHMWMVGVDYNHEIKIVRIENTNGAFGFSAMIGFGLGVAGLNGNNEKCDGSPVCRWGPEAGTPANLRYALNASPDGEKDGIPSVLPVVDINFGVRFNFGNRVALRLEGGFHDMFFLGGSLGLMF